MLEGYSLIILLFKDIIFSLLETKITNLFSLATPRVVVGSLTLASQLQHMLEQLELFLTMLPLKSIVNTFFIQSTPNVCTAIAR